MKQTFLIVLVFSTPRKELVKKLVRVSFLCKEQYNAQYELQTSNLTITNCATPLNNVSIQVFINFLQYLFEVSIIICGRQGVHKNLPRKKKIDS